MPEGLTLVILEPRARPREAEVRKGLTLGRGPGSRVRLRDRSVSAEHAIVGRDGDGWILCNLAELNPIRVRQKDAETQLGMDQEHPLLAGMVFFLGEVEVRVAAAASASLSPTTGTLPAFEPPGSWPTPPLPGETTTLAGAPVGAGKTPLGTEVAAEATPSAARSDPPTTKDSAPIGAGLAFPRPPASGPELPPSAPQPSGPAPSVASHPLSEEPPTKKGPPALDTTLTEAIVSTEDPPSGPVETRTQGAGTLQVETGPRKTEYSDLLLANPRLVLASEGLHSIERLLDHFESKDGGDSYVCLLGRETQEMGPKGCRIRDPSISGLHGKILFRQGSFYLLDTGKDGSGSRNGSRILGRREMDEYRLVPDSDPIVPGKPERLTADAYLRLGFVNALFVVSWDASIGRLEPEIYRKTANLLVTRGELEKARLREALGRLRRDAKEQRHLGAILLRDEHVTPEKWALAFKKVCNYQELMEPGRWGRLLRRLTGK